MKGAGACHMCGRCSDYRGAVTLARRSPNHEIVHVAGDMTNPWQSALILFGLLGVAAGAFHWGNSDLYVAIKQTLADRLADHHLIWPMEPVLPWYVLTNYPDLNDTMTPLDGAVLLLYIGGVAVAMGLGLSFFLALAARACGPWSSRAFPPFCARSDPRRRLRGLPRPVFADRDHAQGRGNRPAFRRRPARGAADRRRIVVLVARLEHRGNQDASDCATARRDFGLFRRDRAGVPRLGQPVLENHLSVILARKAGEGDDVPRD